MKKIISILLAVAMVICSFAFAVSAADTVSYEQPFPTGANDSETFRIPAILTLNDGSVMAAADMRYSHGTDSPNNIDTVVAVSADGYTGWTYNGINYFDDCEDHAIMSDSASFIDSAIIQSKTTNRIFILTDAFPSSTGYLQSLKGTGFIDVNGNKVLALTDGDSSKKTDTYGYYVGAFENGFASVYKIDGTSTEYSVDSEYDLFLNGAPVYMSQKGSSEQIQQNVFYSDSVYHIYQTSYLWLRYSDDNGATWSAPEILNSQVKNESEPFLGVDPGHGFVTTVNGTERIIFAVYDNSGATEKVSTIYSDDNGATWTRGNKTSYRIGVGKTSEAQIVELNNGTLRMYARNSSKHVAYADSTDGGVTWSKFVADAVLSSNGNCMVSFINTDLTVDGKPVILGSFASDTSERADGVVVTGVVNADNTVEWISTYHVNDGFFAYSCLTQLSDGKIGYLYEDEAAHISYMILTVGTDGTVSEVNGNNCEYDTTVSAWMEFINKIKDFFLKIIQFLNIL